MSERVLIVDREPPSGFMTADRAALEDEFAIEHVSYAGRPTMAFVVATWRAVRRCDAVYAFFASEHALVPVLLAKACRRRVVLTVGGYDVACDRVHRYGLAATHRGWLPKLLCRLADAVLPMSEAAAEELLALAPSVAGKVTVAYLAVDGSEWPDVAVPRDSSRVVTVAYVDEDSWSRKGIDRFIAAARHDPHRQYVLAGRVSRAIESRLASARAPNLVVTGYLSHSELNRLLWSAGMYAQLSWHEGFGFAMVEAMLCGCVPVISDLAALRETAGRWAVVVTPKQGVDAAFGHAAAASTDRLAMRTDVAARFSLEARAVALARAIHGD
jgi:glycosyltransferase involved in cell wall biosynthesis